MVNNKIYFGFIFVSIVQKNRKYDILWMDKKWLQDFITSEGKQVYVPDFPIGVGYPNYENWSKLLKYYLDLDLGLGLINENTTIIAHSIAPVFVSKFLVDYNK